MSCIITLVMQRPFVQLPDQILSRVSAAFFPIFIQVSWFLRTTLKIARPFAENCMKFALFTKNFRCTLKFDASARYLSNQLRHTYLVKMAAFPDGFRQNRNRNKITIDTRRLICIERLVFGVWKLHHTGLLV